MTTDEAARLHLYERAKESWDDDAAQTLMSSLPWGVAGLATKQDLEGLRAATKHDIDGVRKDLQVLEERVMARIDLRRAQAIRSIVVSMIAANATMAGLVIAGVQLAS